MLIEKRPGKAAWRRNLDALLDRLIGFPNITLRYRAHWRIMSGAHPMILTLIEDSPRGQRARAMAEGWLRGLDR